MSEEHYDGGIAVNGHSYRDSALRTSNTNFALLVSTASPSPSTSPLSTSSPSWANIHRGIMVQRGIF